MESHEDDEEGWDTNPLGWMFSDFPPPEQGATAALERYQRNLQVWESAMYYRGPLMMLRLPHPTRFFTLYGPCDWPVPLGPEAYRIEQQGTEWSVTFVPLEQEIYRGAGPVELLPAPDQFGPDPGVSAS